MTLFDLKICVKTTFAGNTAFSLFASDLGMNEKAITKLIFQKFNITFENKHYSFIYKKLIGFDISTPEGSFVANEKNVFKTEYLVFTKTACGILGKEFLNY